MRSHPTSRRAFTLIETVVAMGISAILMLALGSVVLVASRAIPTGDEPVVTNGQVERALALLESDLELATGIKSVVGTLAISVPDRDGDGDPEEIVYDWSGDDAMVVRTRNGSADEVLLGPVSFMTVVTTVDASARTERASVVMVLRDAEPSARSLHVRLLNRP